MAERSLQQRAVASSWIGLASPARYATGRRVSATQNQSAPSAPRPRPRASAGAAE